ncbi:MAG: cation transporter [Bacteroidia bacterium]|nr:cation transporter [Bacteroidia bacterium]
MTTEEVQPRRLLRTAYLLGIITVIYNIAEGLISIVFGASGDSLTLLGFGIDSFVEVISGLGIVHMISRMKRDQEVSVWDKAETQALWITGISFFILAAGLVISSILKIIHHSEPTTTLAGIIISVVSILAMWILMRQKIKVGKAMGSEAVLADAACTRTCLYLSFVLFFASAGYEIFRIPYLDIAGALAIAGFAVHEGFEAIEKAKSDSLVCKNVN